jgi:orotidine-5'-phosphate decarboxylase
VADRVASSARDRLALALDFSSLDEARRLAELCAPWFKTMKVGLELFAASGPDAVRRLRGDGFDVFVDLKLHDIPATVRRAAAAIAGLGASYTTLHAAGGRAMLEAAAEGLAGQPTIGLAVTALTSEPATAAEVTERARLAERAGLGGVICAVGDVAAIRAVAPNLFLAVPGIRLGAVTGDDQRRTGRPEQAIAAGADLLVVGRPVTAAADPAAASRQVATAVEQAS